MKIQKNLALLLVSTSAIATNSVPAKAIQYKGASVYKATENGITTVYFDGTAGNHIAVDLGNVTKTLSKVAGACGEVKISVPKGNSSFTGLKVNGTAIDYSALPVNTLPTCKNGALSQARTANFKTAKGQVIIVGKTPNASVSVILPSDQKKNITINSCGIGVLRGIKGNTLPAAFSANGTNYTLASLPDAGHGPVCKKATDGTYSAYTPSGWPK